MHSESAVAVVGPGVVVVVAVVVVVVMLLLPLLPLLPLVCGLEKK